MRFARVLAVISLAAGFLVLGAGRASALASVSGVSPNVVGQGAAGVQLTISGSGFSSSGGAPVASVSGTGVTVTNTALLSATTIVATIDVTAAATLGARNVTVSQGTLGLDSSTCASCLTIAQGPAVSTVLPASATNTSGSSAVPFTLTGTGFVAGAQVRLVHSGQPDIVLTGATVTNGGTTISASADLRGQPPGFRWSVVVTNPDKGSGQFGDGSATGFLLTGGAPTLTSVTPSARGRGATGQVLTLTGTNLARGAAVTFSPATGITTSQPTWVSLTSFQVTVDVGPTAALGAHDVTVTNTDTQSAALVSGFTVNDAPTVTSLSPSALGQGATNPVVVTGTGFVGTPTVTFSGVGVSATNVTRDSSTQLTIQVTVTPTAAIGTRNVTVTNPDAGAGSLAAGFTVNAAPTLTNIAPSSAGQNAPNQNLVFTGTGFVATPTVLFSGSGITVNTVVRDNAAQLTVNVTIASNAPPGPRDVTVTNPDKGTTTLVAGFAVGAGPTITALNPSSRGQASTSQAVIVNGSGFVATPAVSISGTGVSVDNVVFNSATQLTINVTVLAAAPTTARDVTVTNPDNGSFTVSGAFTVTPRPTATGATPNSVGQGFAGTVHITGTAFAGTPTVAFTGTGVSAGAASSVTPTGFDVPVVVASNATTGARDITVTNGDAGVSTACSGCLTILTGPTVTSITPTGGATGGTTTITNLAGTGFAAGAVVKLERSGQPSITMTGTTVTNGGTKITGSFDLSGGGVPVAPGLWDVRVTNPDNGSAVLAGGFTVSNSNPSVSNANPAAVVQGQSPLVHISGANFAQGAVVTISGTGVTASNTTVQSSSQIDVTLTVTSGATPAARNVTVTNTDAQAGQCTGCLTVNARPTITDVNPNQLPRGASGQNVVITGTGFAGTPVVSLGAGITVDTVTPVSSTQLSVSISIDPGATPGVRDVTVTNADTGSVTAPSAFTVLAAAPIVSNLTPAWGLRGATGKQIQVHGTGFQNGATVAFSNAGVSVTNVAFGSTTLLTVTISVTPGAALGLSDVTVTNPDTGHGTATGAFTVRSQLPTVYRSGTWLYHGSLTTGAAEYGFAYGTDSYTPVSGDWDGNGTVTPGLYDPANGMFYLRNDYAPGPPDITVHYGGGSYMPVVGDWNGDGTDTIGVYDPAGYFYLRNTNNGGPPSIIVHYGGGSYIPVVGDWNGDGTDTIGVYDPAGYFYLRNTNDSGPPSITAHYGGGPSIIPIVGDWNGDGTDTVGVFQNGTWYLASATNASAGQTIFSFGQGGDRPLRWQ